MKSKFVGIIVLLVCLAVMPLMASAQKTEVQAGDVEVISSDQAYPSYLAAPGGEGPYPAVVLIHSFRGLEEGYRTMTDQLASEGFVVLSIGWQTFEQQPSDDTMKQLVEDSIAFLSERGDVDAERIGLTGFCAGGRYTMLLLPQIQSLKAGVAWYGFPYNGDTAAASLIDQLTAPMLIIHGTEDQPSPINEIYEYATELQSANAVFELKVYSGEPHGFMLANGQLRDDDVAQDAFNEMADFFKRKLGAETPA
ncbi:MAG: dienelactone hydrolase family protein [Anaerolineae bacterium]|nr:dienelactone hydrolase family protein [Anaerolineae bacterium]